MKIIALWLSAAVPLFAAATDEFITDASQRHGAFGEKAARFLVEHMPESDRTSLTAAFLNENLDLALKARATFPWAQNVPEEIFFNDVLPYAVFDEPRDPWRADFFAKAAPLVKDAKTASDAAQILNRDFFKLINTHYHTKRRRTNQSPKESIEQGKATCTGLSIILVAACRSVGIPARAAGTPLWSDSSGNHTWVEIHDGGWHFTGADEFNAKGLNHAWFVEKASNADPDHPLHAVYATSWKKDQGIFPMAWAPRSLDVGGVNVTARYRVASAAPASSIGVRFFEGGERAVMNGSLTTAAGFPLHGFTTKAGTADMNDTPRIAVTPGESYRLRFIIHGTAHETDVFTIDAKDKGIRDIRAGDLMPAPAFDDESAPLSRENAARAVQFVYESLLAAQREQRAAELDALSITLGDKSLKWLEKSFGDAPAGSRPLWISLHGGGEAPAEINTRQWHNQIRLYQPEQGIYLAPRAPTNKWNMWHEDHIDPLFSRLIENMVALRGVDPDKIYLMGYSAGGDGVWQLAPRMADRFAAAAMMAGHPNESSLLGLRNLPFAIFMGENDRAHNRSKVAAEKSAEIAALQKADPGGYTHLSRIYPGLGHWMELKDAEALPWMIQFTRNPWPRKIVWFQDDVTHARFHWLRLPPGTAAKGMKITAALEGRVIRIDGDVPAGTRVLLSDRLLDLDQPVGVSINQGPVRETRPVRNLRAIRTALAERLDPAATPTAEIVAGEEI